MTNHRIIVTGHRGAAAVQPENTLRGINYALSLGVERIEIDVQLSRDQQLIVMHDATVDRTTNGTGKIADLTLAEIKTLDAGAGEQVPTLQDVIDEFQVAWQQRSQTLLVIELKGEATAAPTVEVVQKNGVEDKVLLLSFHRDRVTEAKRLLPKVRTGFISSSLDPDPIVITQQIGAESVHLHHEQATREWVERAHAAGLKTDVWNIDDAERMKWAIDLGVDGISSNNPALLIKILAGKR